MDSVSHLTIGSTLAGLLTNIPEISNHYEFMLPITISCIVGSLAPDLDVMTRLKPELYLRYHRGASHSIFLFPLWSLLVTGLLSACWTNIPFLLLWLSVSLGYFFHIALDLLNSYGTQIAYPFRPDRKGYHLLPLFDPVLWSAHVVCALIWLQQRLGTGYPFLFLYAGSTAYMKSDGLIFVTCKERTTVLWLVFSWINISPSSGLISAGSNRRSDGIAGNSRHHHMSSNSAPSTYTVGPVTSDDFGEARNSTRSATCSGEPGSCCSGNLSSDSFHTQIRDIRLIRWNGMINYIALGDSITFGQNASFSCKAYPSRVTSMLKLKGIQAKLIVLAQPSWTSADLSEEIFTDPSLLGCAKVVTVWIGGNDLIHYGLSTLRQPATPIVGMMNRYKRRLDMILGMVRIMRVKHIICCTQYNPFPNSVIAVNAIRIMNQLITSSATTNRCLVARVDRWFSGNEHSLIYGYRGGYAEGALRGFAAVHPNDKGHEVIATGLFSSIYPLIRP